MKYTLAIAVLFGTLTNVYCQDDHTMHRYNPPEIDVEVDHRMYSYNPPEMDAKEFQERYKCSGKFEVFQPCNSSVSILVCMTTHCCGMILILLIVSRTLTLITLIKCITPTPSTSL